MIMKNSTKNIFVSLALAILFLSSAGVTYAAFYYDTVSSYSVISGLTSAQLNTTCYLSTDFVNGQFCTGGKRPQDLDGTNIACKSDAEIKEFMQASWTTGKQYICKTNGTANMCSGNDAWTISCASATTCTPTTCCRTNYPTLWHREVGTFVICNDEATKSQCGPCLAGWQDADDNLGTVEACIEAVPENYWDKTGNDISNNNTGKVGIGIAAPTEKLHVNGDAIINNVYIGNVSGGYAGLINSALNEDLTTEYAILQTGDGNYTVINKKDTGVGSLDLRIGNVTKLTVLNNGNVGIGTASPSVKLQVDGGSNCTLATNTGYIITNDGTTYNVCVDENEIQARNNAAASTLYLNYDGGDIYTAGNFHSSAHVTADAFYDSDDLGRYINPDATSYVENISGYGWISSAVKVNAPIFYDSNNVAYYLNPASSSNVYEMDLNGTNDVTLTNTTGVLRIGNFAGVHMAFDGNEIQARNVSAASPLYLQGSQGDVIIGSGAGIYSSKLVIADYVSGVTYGGDGIIIGSDPAAIYLGPSSSSYGSIGWTDYYKLKIESESNIRLQAADDINIFTGGYQRMKIASNGYVGIGTTTPDYSLDVDGTIRGAMLRDSNNSNRSLDPSATSYLEHLRVWGNFFGSTIQTEGTGNDLSFPESENWQLAKKSTGGAYTVLFTVQNDGDVYVGGTKVHTSDMRMKKDIADSQYGLDAVMKLHPVSFKWKNGDDHTTLGFIAQDVQPVIGDLVYDDALGGKDGENMLGLNYEGFTPVLVKAIQEQQQIIEDLKIRVQSLESQLNK